MDPMNPNMNPNIVALFYLAELLRDTETLRASQAKQVNDMKVSLMQENQAVRRAQEREDHLLSEVRRLEDSLAGAQSANKEMRRQASEAPTPRNQTPLSTYLSDPDKLRNIVSYLELASDTMDRMALIREVSQRTKWDLITCKDMVDDWLSVHTGAMYIIRRIPVKGEPMVYLQDLLSGVVKETNLLINAIRLRGAVGKATLSRLPEGWEMVTLAKATEDAPTPSVTGNIVLRHNYMERGKAIYYYVGLPGYGSVRMDPTAYTLVQSADNARIFETSADAETFLNSVKLTHYQPIEYSQAKHDAAKLVAIPAMPSAAPSQPTIEYVDLNDS